jgi:hypothetical protein
VPSLQQSLIHLQGAEICRLYKARLSHSFVKPFEDRACAEASHCEAKHEPSSLPADWGLQTSSIMDAWGAQSGFGFTANGVFFSSVSVPGP